MKYTVVLQRESDGGYVAIVPSLPGCVSQGDSREEVLKNIEEAIELYIEDVRASGDPLPVEEARFVEAVKLGEAELERGEYLTHEEVGARLGKILAEKSQG